MPRFSDAQLIILLGKAGRRVNRELCLTGTTDEIVVDASGCITPADADLEDLVLLAAECMIVGVDINSDFTDDATSDGILVRDGEQTYDTRSGAVARAAQRVNYLNSDYSPCAEFRKAIRDEKLKRNDELRDIW